MVNNFFSKPAFFLRKVLELFFNFIFYYFFTYFIRYSISLYGKRQSSMLLGNNLNDNKWHHVKIIRTNSLSEARVDDQTKTLISPTGYGVASFNSLAYIGGYEPTRLMITHHQSTAVNYKRAVFKVKNYLSLLCTSHKYSV